MFHVKLCYNGVMKLWYDRKSKDPTYFVQLGIRNGKKTTTKNIARIGRHSDLLKITDDPLSYAKEQVAKFNEEAKLNHQISLELKINFAEKLKASDSLASSSKQLNIGYFFLQQLYHSLEIGSFFDSLTADSKITFDPNLVNRFLTCDRILAPDSKLSSLQHMANYYEQPQFDYMHIMRTMDLMADHYDEYISHLFEKSNNIIKRDTSVCFYDCTNYYFETEMEDEDYVDEVTGETIKGLCKYGPSKEHRPIPLLKWGCSWIRTASLCPCVLLPAQTMNRQPLSHWKKSSHRCFRKRNLYTVQMPALVRSISGTLIPWAAVLLSSPSL